MITNTTKPKRRKGDNKTGQTSDPEESSPESTDDTADNDQNMIMDILASAPKPVHMTGIYGEVNESKAQEAVFSLLLFQKDATQDLPEGTPPEPIEFYVSTYGGAATEMFSVYDVMRVVRETVPVVTCGIGKVMSAGVLLLAAGTKGQRKIGKHCRVMIHGVNSGHSGYIADMENEFAETKFTQTQYVSALAAETDMTLAYIRKLMSKKTNVYLDAQQAVDLGIADIIV
jgi:ATP-dependent Clp protease protease subunit